MRRKALAEAAIIGLLLVLPLALYAPVVFGGRTMLPADTLYQFEPYRAAAPELGIEYPHNHLVADLILENYAWKRFINQAIENRELPLWDPNTFSGHPFLANGQHSALYPLSVVFYVLPLWRAYGVFAWLQLGMAGTFMYMLARVLGAGRLGGLVGGITFQFSGFMVVSFVHPMIVAGAAWLPLIIAAVELIVERRPLFGRPTTLPWLLVGALALGCQMLAGHAENTYFTLLVAGAFAAWRILVGPSGRGSSDGTRWPRWRPVPWLAGMVVLGLALGAVQFIPMYEVVTTSFRGGEGAATFEQVRGWAYPWRRLITFAVPNFFGNPSHHGYFDLFTRTWTAAKRFPDGQYVDWGIKNFVEGGAYLGLLPICLALVAAMAWLRTRVGRLAARGREVPGRGDGGGGGDGRGELPGTAQALRHVPFFALLALLSLAFVFGTPLYAIVYMLPGLNQSHSPFRWVFPLTVAAAVLAAIGLDVVRRAAADRGRREKPRSALARVLLMGAQPEPAAVVAAVATWGGVIVLLALGASWIAFPHIETHVARFFQGLALAPEAFTDHRAFYSYEFRWVATFGLLLAATGLVLRLGLAATSRRHKALWAAAVVALLIADFMAFGSGFNPAVGAELLEHIPESVRFLRSDETHWRYATFTPPGTTKTLNANSGMFYDLQTVAGYDSLFSRQYADFMSLIEPQDELQYNRIASFREWSSLDSPLTDLLNVKYIVSEVDIPNEAKYRLVYEDPAVRIYQNLAAMPRAFTLPFTSTVVSEDVAGALREFDPHSFVIAEPGDGPEGVPAGGSQPGSAVLAEIARYEGNEVVVRASPAERSWLVLADSFAPGWRAFVRPAGAAEGAEQEAAVVRVDGNFRGVVLEPGDWEVRFRYSPDSVKVGAFLTFIAGMVVLLLAGIYLWRYFYRGVDDANTVRRVAKNSIAPIVINLFTRLVEMAFAALAARLLGPTGIGRYATAISIYLWFDTIANFGLDMYAMREVARDRSRVRTVFTNTTVLRVALYVGIAPLLAGFLGMRQSLGEPLAQETVWATALLYAGLLPFSLANGLAALFRGFEKHEYPAVIQTVTTIIKVTLGVLVLVGGVGIVGLAGAAILTNTVTLGILIVLSRRMIWRQVPPGGGRLSWTTQREMLAESWPLMASLLLQVLFPTLNVLLLQSLQGDAVVGWYDAARKWVDAFNIVPSFFTFAVFPVVSRLAAEDRTNLARSYHLSVKLLTMLTIPISICVTLLAQPLVRLLSGPAFLPEGAEVLQVLIWSSLFGWLNGLTNYVLIAMRRQRFVLLASAARIAFTLVANLLLVRRFGYIASAAIIVGGELLLALLFTIDLRRQIGSLRMVRAVARPAAAGIAMAAVAWIASHAGPIAAVALGLLVYGVGLIVLRVFTPEEQELLSPLVPERVKLALPRLWARRPGGQA